MDFELTDEQQLIRDAVREFAEAEIVPIAAEIDRDHRFPAELLPKLAEMNLMGMTFPEKEGGAGTDYVSYVIAVEEISRACASTGIIMSSHNSLATWPIYTFGTRAQKDQYMHDMTSGRRLGAFALTEPAAGTDAAAGTCTATRDGDEYVLNGSKMFISNAPHAEIYIVFAKTDTTKGTRGISAFIVERDTPGFSVGEAEHKMGIRGSSTPPIYFTDCRIPKEALLGEEGEGFKIAMATLDGGRIGVSAQALGIAQAALDAAVAYAKERVQFGKPIANLQAIQWMLADMALEIDAARLLVYRAAWCAGSGRVLFHRGRDGQAVRVRGGHPGGRQGDPDPRRIRLHGSLSGGAALPRREDHRTVRGNVRGAADGHCEKRPALRTTGHHRLPWLPSGGS